MSIKLFSLAKELNIGVNSLVAFLHNKGREVDNNPNARISEDEFDLILKDFTPAFDEEIAENAKRKFLRNKNTSKTKQEISESPLAPQGSEKQASKQPMTGETLPSPAIGTPSQLNVIGKIELDKHNNPLTTKARKGSKKTPEPKGTCPTLAKPVDISTSKDPSKEQPTKIAPESTPKVTPKLQRVEETSTLTDPPKITKVVDDTHRALKPLDHKEEVQNTSPAERTDAGQEQSHFQVTELPTTKAKESKGTTGKEHKTISSKGLASHEVSPSSTVMPPTESTAKDLPLDTKTNDSGSSSLKENTEIYRITKKEAEPQLKVVGKIDLSSFKSPHSKKASTDKEETGRRKRKRISSNAVDVRSEGAKIQEDRTKKARSSQTSNNRPASNRNERHTGRKAKRLEPALTPEEQDELRAKQVKETLARLNNKQTAFGRAAKSRREKRDARRAEFEKEIELSTQKEKVLKLTEFVTVSDLANMMNVPVTDVISTCMSIDMMVSINQRLDAETINIVAEEFGYETEFVSANVVEAISADEEPDKPEDLESRPPVITIMGHVDHGKTSLLDCIRRSDVIAGEAGGITQHIGAYNVTLSDKRRLTVLDTPGHEAFTAMRARGAQVTDIAVIVIAANDAVMPQTIEALNHASAAGVPIIFAINKIDVNGANPDKIREQLAAMNYLVEDWGGKYQVQEISAKKGIGIPDLLDKVFLEAELLELKANPKRRASGSIIESSLDKGKGYLASVLIQRGTLHIGDYILAGSCYGRVKAMYNEYNQRIKTAGLSTAVSVLGCNGAPTAGDDFNVMESEQAARDLAVKREQLQREQGLRTQKMLTLDDIGRRIAVGNFQQFNLIIKGDVDGSVQALANSLIELSTKEIQVRVIHQGVGQISESDIQLATASDAVIIGFQVRPSAQARKLAEQEGVEIRTYSIIYDAIEDVHDALEGMLSPDIREQVTANLEVLQTFKVSKIGTIAGCMVTDGKIKRTDKVRVIRDGVVIHTGELESLKRFKDEAKEVASGLECGINIKNYNNIQVGDLIESFEEIEVRRKL